MAQYLNIINAQIAALDNAEVATWQASGLLDGDTVLNIETGELVIYNFDPDTFTFIPLGSPQAYGAQHANVTGTLIDTNLIDLVQVIGVFINGSMSLWTVNGTPQPGVSVDVNTVTGEVDPGYPWDGDTVVVQYTSFIPPIFAP
jgi:hypothetical protein